MRPRDVPAARLLAALLGAALTLTAVPAAAVVRTPEIDAKRAEAAEAQDRLEDMAADLEEKVEAYNAVAEALSQTRARTRAVEARLVSERAALAESRAQLGTRAEGMYRSGGVELLEVLLGTASFNDFLSRLEWASRVAEADAALVSRTEAAERAVEDAQRTLEAREAEQAALKRQAAGTRSEVEAALGRQQAYLASLNAEIGSLVKAEQERQRREAEERARKAREAAARRAAAARGAGGTSAVRRTGSGAGADVVDIALGYLGVPYVWGGTSPKGFDCSGLMVYSYRQVGVDLPRTSRSQFNVGKRIPKDRLDLLQPGDLVFFGRGGDPGRVHHVGMYIGDGQFVHAPQTGDVVRITSLTERIERRGDYVGASRVL